MNLSNSCEGITAGTSVTAGSQTGGASGDAFDSVTTGTATLTADATHPAHGTGVGYDITQPATLSVCYLAWTTSLGTLSTNQTLYGRVYMYIPTIPTTSTRVVQFLNGTTTLGSLSIASGANSIQWRNNADSSVGVVGTAMPTNSLIRMEFQVTGLGGGTTALGGTANWYTGDNATTANTPSTLSGAAGGTLAPNAVRYGCASASGAVSSSLWIDGMNINDIGLPGPETVAPPLALAYQPHRMPLGV
jgi:hypothetical protein